MIIKNISEETLLINVNGQKVEVGEGVLFSIDSKSGDQLLNMYPNKLSQQVVLDFAFSNVYPIELEEESGTITTEGEFEGQLGLLDHDLYAYLNETRVQLNPEEVVDNGGDGGVVVDNGEE